MALIYCPRPAKNRVMTGVASVLVILGGMASLYVIVIGGQSFPMTLLPGYEATSTFSDGIVGQYTPSQWELMLGLGGVAVALLIVIFAMKLFRLLPETLEDSVADPHHS